MLSESYRTSLTAVLWFSLGMVATAPAVSQDEDSADKAAVEQAVRDFYYHIKVYDVNSMRTASTPGFEIIYAGVRLDFDEFEARHIAEEEELGPTESRPGRMDWQNTSFEIEIDGDLAYSSSREVNPGTPNNYFDYWILKRAGDEWKVHRVFHMPMADDVTP